MELFRQSSLLRMPLQVLNVAWAGHEIVSSYMDDMFAFFERPAPEDYELQPMSGLTLPKAQLRAGAALLCAPCTQTKLAKLHGGVAVP